MQFSCFPPVQYKCEKYKQKIAVKKAPSIFIILKETKAYYFRGTTLFGM